LLATGGIGGSCGTTNQACGLIIIAKNVVVSANINLEWRQWW
jgi:hypothetical protein